MIVTLIRRIFGWWDTATIGTSIFTKFQGTKVGEDDQGNIYYIHKKDNRRWVIYNGDIDASRIPPEWHAWIHYTIDTTPLEKPMVMQSWEKPHEPNKTGTVEAYAPTGSLNNKGKRPKVTGDYQAWTPNS